MRPPSACLTKFQVTSGSHFANHCSPDGGCAVRSRAVHVAVTGPQILRAHKYTGCWKRPVACEPAAAKILGEWKTRGGKTSSGDPAEGETGGPRRQGDSFPHAEAGGPPHLALCHLISLKAQTSSPLFLEPLSLFLRLKLTDARPEGGKRHRYKLLIVCGPDKSLQQAGETTSNKCLWTTCYVPCTLCWVLRAPEMQVHHPDLEELTVYNNTNRHVVLGQGRHAGVSRLCAAQLQEHHSHSPGQGRRPLELCVRQPYAATVCLGIQGLI